MQKRGAKSAPSAGTISVRQKKRSRGRPPTGIRPISLRLSEVETARVDAWAERRGLSRSDAIRVMIAEALGRGLLPGRPKGSKKLNRNWHLQLFLDWLQLKQQAGGKLSKRRGAELLVKAKRYEAITHEWLRHYLRDPGGSEGLGGLGRTEGLKVCGPSADDGSYTLENRDGDIRVMIVLGLDDNAPPHIHEHIRIDCSHVRLRVPGKSEWED